MTQRATKGGIPGVHLIQWLKHAPQGQGNHARKPQPEVYDRANSSRHGSSRGHRMITPAGGNLGSPRPPPWADPRQADSKGQPTARRHEPPLRHMPQNWSRDPAQRHQSGSTCSSQHCRNGHSRTRAQLSITVVTSPAGNHFYAHIHARAAKVTVGRSRLQAHHVLLQTSTAVTSTKASAAMHAPPPPRAQVGGPHTQAPTLLSAQNSWHCRPRQARPKAVRTSLPVRAAAPVPPWQTSPPGAPAPANPALALPQGKTDLQPPHILAAVPKGGQAAASQNHTEFTAGSRKDLIPPKKKVAARPSTKALHPQDASL